MRTARFVKLLSLQVAALLLAGCAAANKCPPLEPGMAGLEIRAVAEPKQGVSPADNPDSYGASGPAGRLQPLDYENFAGIVVWVEPVSGSAVSSATDSATSTTIAFDDRGPIGGSIARGVSVGSKLVIETAANSRSRSTACLTETSSTCTQSRRVSRRNMWCDRRERLKC